ncbi:hypothetical protein DZA07_10220 [Pseudomonas aeruginosa]|nr:hypothetical protein [Pseudomonas aeruginosa]OPD81193.1 hypothetical protein AO935_31945 [Pseudomonas aeruginosa]OPE19675.1 hypothetical protein APA93_30535 [Pseudomonas aeruginosa]OWI06667.1 hypothetical protein CDC12_13285 [Pseudomonas aeruginosa]OXZ47344.1 hypothetical protein CIW79_00045 [Pseudomonas aeruginosa]
MLLGPAGRLVTRSLTRLEGDVRARFSDLWVKNSCERLCLCIQKGQRMFEGVSPHFYQLSVTPPSGRSRALGTRGGKGWCAGCRCLCTLFRYQPPACLTHARERGSAQATSRTHKVRDR